MLYIFYFFHQLRPRVFHQRNAKAFLPRIFQRGSDVIHRFAIQNQEY